MECEGKQCIQVNKKLKGDIYRDCTKRKVHSGMQV